jgi:hypothetical protein
MLGDTTRISEALVKVRLDLACEPIRDYWYQLFNSGENEDENEDENLNGKGKEEKRRVVTALFVNLI